MQLEEILRPGLFNGKTAFVTGGGSGINLGIAKSFATLGASIAICGRTSERLEAAAAELEELGAKTFTQVADVRDYEAVAAAFEGTRRTLGPIDVLVCGAAGNFLAPAEKMSANGFKTVVEIDLVGAFNASRAAFEQLKETRGSLIFVSAGQAYIPYFAQAHAGAAKAGIDNLMRNLALEWGRYGIRSNSVSPGPIDDTEGMRRLGPADSSLHDAMRAALPLGRLGTVEDVGRVAVFLASPLAAYVTGTRVDADGGMNLQGSGIYAQYMGAGQTSPDS